MENRLENRPSTPERAMPHGCRERYAVRSLRIALPILGVAVAGIGLIGAIRSYAAVQEAAPLFSDAVVSRPAPAVLTDLEEAITKLASRVIPAVVGIETRTLHPAVGPQGGRSERMPRGEITIGAGSGFLINPEGYIVTCGHVVASASRVTVQLDDRRKMPARVVGRDQLGDIALLKIESKAPLPYVALGHSDGVRVGQLAFTIGNPFGILRNSLSMGIVSGMGRGLLTSGVVGGLIQTDANINPGNSGGPLVDLHGHVIGVANAKMESGGVGFAIPIDPVRDVLPQLLEYGTASRGFLGVYLDEDVRGGVRIAAVTAGTPAVEAGLRRNDIIRAVDGKPVETLVEIQRLISGHRARERVKLLLERDSREITKVITLAEREDG